MSAPVVDSAAQSDEAREGLFEEEALGKAYDAKLLRRLWPYVRPYWPQVLTTVLMLVPLTLIDLLPALIVREGIDGYLNPAGAVAPGAGMLGGLREGFRAAVEAPTGVPPLAWLAGLYFLVAALGSLFQFADMWVMSWTGQSAMRDLRRVVFGHIQRLHLGFFDTVPVGRLVTRATNDVENVAEMFSAGIVALVRDVLKMAVIAIALFIIDPYLATLVFCLIPVLAVVAVVFRFKVRQAFRAVRVRIARINAYLQENVTGMKVVQLFARERRNQRDFEAMNADHRDAWLQSIRYDSALFAVVEFASNLTLAVVIWQSFGTVALGTLFIFFDWTRRFFMPLRDLSAKYSVMQSSMASCERIFQLLDAKAEVANAPGAEAPTSREGRVEFEHVWFAYNAPPGCEPGDPEVDWVLRDVSFTVEAGKRGAFVGATGAGKTTIIKLLTRLYDVTHGRILIDGVELRDWPQESLRQRVAMVLQDVFLFSGSVADNISLDREDVSRADVEHVSRAVQAHEFISKLAQGYDTSVRERGSNFSAGQRQLLSFARALAHGADILVLDEATSSIDTETEGLVQEGIHVLMEGKTALVIAHRLSTIQDVDTIFVLHKGRLVEQGSHDELLEKDGIYRHLYQLQYARQRETAAVAAS
jgi:ATP-binding cassette subfamily B protein